jgi:hypothetical protein
MGNKLFGADIAGEINKALGNLQGFSGSVVLTKVSVGTRTSGDPGAGTNPTETTYTVNGFVDSYQDQRTFETLVQSGDRVVSIFGDSLPSGIVPSSDDKVTTEGQTYTIVAVSRDPDRALYECLSRA